MAESNQEALDKSICMVKTKCIPILLNCIFLIGSDGVFCFCYLYEFDAKISHIGAIILGVINNLIVFMILLSMYRVCQTDAGSVPIDLKFQRSEVARKYIRRRRDIKEQIEAGADPNSINFSSGCDEDIEASHEVIDLDLHNEDSKSKSEETARSSEVFDTNGSQIDRSNLNNFIKSQIKFRYCEECDNIRPPRTKHCEICMKCTLKYDHHCSYVANCIGFHNHKYFILMLFYITFGCIFESLCFIFGWSQKFFGGIRASLFSVCFFVENIAVILTTVSVSMLFLMAVIMVIKNTSVSEVKSIDKIFDDDNIFNIGYMNNIKMIMGDNVWTWWFPTKNINRVCNGIDFPINAKGSK